MFGSVPNRGPPDGIVAVFLQSADVSGEAAQHVNNLGIVLGIGSELLDGGGVEQHGGELGGGDLKADLGNLGGVILAKVIGEIILQVRELKLALLFGAPFHITAASFPIGDVAFSDRDFHLVESSNDFGMGNIVVEHAIDHVALQFRETSDFTVASMRFGGACQVVVEMLDGQSARAGGWSGRMA